MKEQQQIINLDKKYVWHPFTQMKDYERRDHILIKKAEGIKLYDYDNKFYYDIISSWWCNLLGHNIPEINDTIQNQLKQFEHTLFAGTTNKPAVLLAEKLINISHKNLNKVFYSDNGSTSVEVALKLSYQYWRNQNNNTKKKFVYLENGYHGDTLGAMSISGTSGFNNKFKDLFFESYSIDSPYCFKCRYKKNCSFQCLDKLEKLLENHHTEICGIILEPLLQAAGGMIIYPSEYLDRLYETVKQYDVHIILDEIATGFGRTGKMFAYNYSKIVPDFVCLSKALTNGTLPLGVTLTSDKIYSLFYSDYNKNKTFFHGHTFTGNPISCAVGLKTLELIEKNNVITKFNQINKYINNKINNKYKDYKFFADIRNIGAVFVFEISEHIKEERIGWKIYLESLKHNLILRPLGNIIYFYLPLVVTENDMDDILNKFDITIKNIFE